MGLHLTEAIEKENIEIPKGKLNLIVAPTGCGKTRFATKLLSDLPPDKMGLYVIDTTMGKQALLDNPAFQELSPLWIDAAEGHTHLDLTHSDLAPILQKPIVITYAKLGYLLRDRPLIAEHLGAIVFDEIHKLYKFLGMNANSTFNPIQQVRNEMVQLGLPAHKLMDCTIVGLTATPDQFYKFAAMPNKPPIKFEELKLQSPLKSYAPTHTTYFKNVHNLLEHLEWDSGKRVIVFSRTIAKMKTIANNLSELGVSSVALWSSNSSHSLSLDQLIAKQTMVEQHTFPEKYQVLILNEAFDTSFNLFDQSIQWVVVDDSNPTTIAQFSGRLRFDYEHLYVLDREGGEEWSKKEGLIAAEWIGLKMTREKRDEFVDWWNRDGGKDKWPKIKKELELHQYKVVEGRATSGKREKFWEIRK